MSNYHMRINEDKVHNEEMVIQTLSIGISMHKDYKEFPWKRRIWIMPTISFNTSSIRGSTSSVNIEDKEHPRQTQSSKKHKKHTLCL